jgi:MSHA biogenesis protein MshK
MAQSLKRKMASGMAIIGCIGFSVLPVSMAGAQTLPDPTRPPHQLEQGGTAIEAAIGPVLQSVLISPGRRMAIISGQAVSLGGQFEGARLIKITESEVVLRNASGLQTLKLFPDIKKQMAAARPLKNSAHRN